MKNLKIKNSFRKKENFVKRTNMLEGDSISNK